MKKQIILFLVMGVCMMLCGAGNRSEQRKEPQNIINQSKMDQEDHQELLALFEKENDVNLDVHTYSGERYTVKGDITDVSSHPQHEEIILEVRGDTSVEQKQMKNKQEKIPEGGSFSINVTTPEGEVYGFQSNHEVKIETKNGRNQIEMYGYLLGYEM